jgi:hypothetical protein
VTLVFAVIAGLDPATHATKRLEQNLDWLTSLRVGMDRRVKPGGDEENVMALTKLARLPP